MKGFLQLAKNKIAILVPTLIALTISAQNGHAQCPTGVTPTYTKTCSVEFYQSITASGIGVVSTIGVSGITSCTSTYINDFATQGVTAPAGNTVNINITRPTGYTAYLSIYTDWNNNGTFDLSELCGSTITIPSTVSTALYTFPVPTTGITAGVKVPMRIFISEAATGQPCNGTYGQTYDFYFDPTCPPVTITTSPSTDSVCISGNGDTLTASGAGTGGTYTWSPTTGISSTTGAVVVVSPTVAITYTVTGTTSIGCSSSGYDTIKINPSPAIPPDSAFGSRKFCSGDSVRLKDTVNLDGFTYQWYNSSTLIPGATDTSYVVKSSGSYAIQITDTLGCFSFSKLITVTVNPLPNPIVTFDGKIFRTGKYYVTYQWYENNVAITAATYDSVIAHTNGNYKVKVTDTNGCQDTSTTYVLKKLDLSNTINGAISIYPNPSTGIIHIESPVIVCSVISDLAGKTIIQKANAKEMDIRSLPRGLYIIQLIDPDGHRLKIEQLIKE